MIPRGLSPYFVCKIPNEKKNVAFHTVCGKKALKMCQKPNLNKLL